MRAAFLYFLFLTGAAKEGKDLLKAGVDGSDRGHIHAAPYRFSTALVKLEPGICCQDE